MASRKEKKLRHSIFALPRIATVYQTRDHSIDSTAQRHNTARTEYTIYIVRDKMRALALTESREH